MFSSSETTKVARVGKNVRCTFEKRRSLEREDPKWHAEVNRQAGETRRWKGWFAAHCIYTYDSKNGGLVRGLGSVEQASNQYKARGYR